MEGSALDMCFLKDVTKAKVCFRLEPSMKPKKLRIKTEKNDSENGTLHLWFDNRSKMQGSVLKSNWPFNYIFRSYDREAKR